MRAFKISIKNGTKDQRRKKNMVKQTKTELKEMGDLKKNEKKIKKKNI